MSLRDSFYDRRAALLGLGEAAIASTLALTLGQPAVAADASAASTAWFDVKRDFRASGDGRADDTLALEAAIKAGSEAQRPILLPGGVYPISRALQLPPNTMLIGCDPGLGFGCRLEPVGCPAFIIGGKQESFHCVIENLMIWPHGSAPDFIIAIDNSYSVSFRNVRIHDAQSRLRRAAVVLLGASSTGGHGRCNNIVWDNLVVRNDVEQPPVAVFAAKGCGSHRFIRPCLENYQVLFDWRGGQIDWVLPYTERAGRYALDCNLDPDEETAYLNTFGGAIECADSGLACAIRANTRNFNSFATRWAASAAHAVHFYGEPAQRPNFYGIVPNLAESGPGRFSGVAGWHRWVNFPASAFTSSHELSFEIPANGMATARVQVAQVSPRQHWVRVGFNGDARDVHMSGFVSDAGVVTVALRNLTAKDVQLSGFFTITCELT
jgi:hypothetical protein